MEQKQKGPLPLNLDALVDNTPAAELVVKPSVTVVPDQEPAPFVGGLDRLKDYELVDHILRKKKLLENSAKNLPDKGAKLRALIKSYEDEVHRRKVNPRPQVQKVIDVEQKPRQATSSSAVGVSNYSRQENLPFRPQSEASLASNIMNKRDNNTNCTYVDAFSNEMPHFKHCNNQTVRLNREPKRRKRHRSSTRKLPCQYPNKLSKRDTFNDDKRFRSNSTLSLQNIARNLQRQISKEDMGRAPILPPDAEKYNWVSTEVLGVPSFYNSRERLDTINWVDSALKGHWQVECPGASRRVCSFFEGCCLPMYEILFRKLGVVLPFSDFEMKVLWHLRIAPSQLHPLSWAFVKAFQYWCDYQGSNPSIRLFFNLFLVNGQRHGLILFRQKTKLFESYSESLMPFTDKFIVIRPRSQSAHECLCSVPLSLNEMRSSNCQNLGGGKSHDNISQLDHKALFHPFWTAAHFNYSTSSYIFKNSSLSNSEINLKASLEEFVKGFEPERRQKARFVDVSLLIAAPDSSARKAVFDSMSRLMDWNVMKKKLGVGKRITPSSTVEVVQGTRSEPTVPCEAVQIGCRIPRPAAAKAPFSDEAPGSKRLKVDSNKEMIATGGGNPPHVSKLVPEHITSGLDLNDTGCPVKDHTLKLPSVFTDEQPSTTEDLPNLDPDSRRRRLLINSARRAFKMDGLLTIAADAGSAALRILLMGHAMEVKHETVEKRYQDAAEHAEKWKQKATGFEGRLKEALKEKKAAVKRLGDMKEAKEAAEKERDEQKAEVDRLQRALEEANSFVKAGRRALAVYFDHGFKCATEQVLFFNPEARVDELDPFKVIVDYKLVDEE